MERRRLLDGRRLRTYIRPQRRMNGSIALSGVSFRVVNALQLFKLVYRHFHAVQCTPAAIDRRVEKIAREGEADFLAANGVPMPPGLAAAKKSAVRVLLFFLDLVPQNAERFPVTFAEVQAPDSA